MNWLIFSYLFLCVIPGPLMAKDIFVAPLNVTQSATPDGSNTAPWPSLNAVFAEGVATGGDRILLLPGNHGPLVLKGHHYDPSLRITSATQERAHLDYIEINSSKGIVIADLNVWPRQPEELRAVIFANGKSEDIHVDNLRIMSRPEADHTYFDWTLAAWLGPMRNHGIRLDGVRNKATGNTIFGVDFAITTTGPEAQISGNRILGFSGDAMRSLGDNSVVSGNRVENCFKIGKNHDDGFQAWAPRGREAKVRQILTGLKIINNIILEWTGPPRHPLRCRLQGIGMFGGPYQDIEIINNVISVNSYHGISVYGGKGVTIVHNTVVNSDPDSSETFPWIRVDDRKGGEPASQLIVSNNLAMGFSNASSAPLPAFRETNAQIISPLTMFEDAFAHNYVPRANSAAIDAGDAGVALSYDILGHLRPQGRSPDLGAYEVR